MKRSSAVLVSLLFGSVGIASAETQANVADAPENPLATPYSRPQATYRFIDPGLPTLSGDGVSAHAISNVIYLNNCKPNGCQITPGNEDSKTNRSTIPSRTSTVQPYAYSDDNWNQVVDCVKKTYAPFGVQIVTQRPASGDYHMAIVAGVPQNVQMEQGVGGVSPFTCGYIGNAISFSFANVYGGNVDDICWTVAQETAHSWGLDHKFDNRDPMTYLGSGPSRKTFQNEGGSCGEFSARQCQCQYAGGKLNSFKEIMETFGSSTPTPPTVTITAPSNGANVDAGFPIRADIVDDLGASKAELYIDNRLISTLTVAPWVWNAPQDLAQGNHVIKVIGYDIGNTPSEKTITVTRGKPCSDDDACTGQGDVCVDGRCVAGASVTGGLGNTCTNNGECKSGQCANDGAAGYCVESCQMGNEGCPDGFGCIAAGNNGVCWPGADDGGCNAMHGDQGLALFGLAFGALLIGRRRRR
ncbi:MAG: Ig-like domain-containing protein [Kofleriaceae bacterium]|nr:Ig-like domain-containing protein [Kofleriaceae bacterium]